MYYETSSPVSSGDQLNMNSVVNFDSEYNFSGRFITRAKAFPKVPPGDKALTYSPKTLLTSAKFNFKYVYCSVGL